MKSGALLLVLGALIIALAVGIGCTQQQPTGGPPVATGPAPSVRSYCAARHGHNRSPAGDIPHANPEVRPGLHANTQDSTESQAIPVAHANA